jgi:transketolase
MKNTRQVISNAIRFLSMDAVEKAKSGHPGMPMGMADIATVLWREYLSHSPKNPAWINRDRFVVSNGHGSMLLYALLHLTGYELSLEDLKSFRQLHSKTPGHPEYGYTVGVETTTGPLGQGFANAVGMALSEKILAAQFNQKDHDIIDHHTYVFMGDGCLMEGISHEAASLAGTFKLNKLIAFWDDNGISIDGEVEGWFTENIPMRFKSYGWEVIEQVDGHSFDAIERAMDKAKKSDKPVMICCKTTIGFGAPNKAGKEICHGSPLGSDEIGLTRKKLDWAHEPFVIPASVYEDWSAVESGEKKFTAWQKKWQVYEAAYPELAAELSRRLEKKFPATFSQDFTAFIQDLQKESSKAATRKSSQKVIEFVGKRLPEMLGGSADLTGSVFTNFSGSRWINTGDFSGNYIGYGVREFGMSALMNGMALHGGFIPYAGTFLVFSDYARNAIRMSALMKQRVIYILTHDSIGLGEDGPTHQPIEHAASLRLIPNLRVFRPCDTVETAIAWKLALEMLERPSCLLLTRQELPAEPRDEKQLSQVEKGGYVLIEGSADPELIIIATGSEVKLAVAVAKHFSHKRIRVVSMLCAEIFAGQDKHYHDSVLPPTVTKRIAIEAGVSDTWYRYVGLEGKVLGIDRFGESAPADKLFDYFGLTEAKVIKAVEEYLS